MALTLLFKSISDNIDLFLILLGYWMHKTCTRLDFGFSLSLTAFSLAIITGVKVLKIVTSFLNFFWIKSIFVGVMLFSIADIAFNLDNIFSFFFKNDINICDREIVVTTLFLSSVVSKTFLVILVLLIGLIQALMDGFSIKHVSKRKISGFNLSKIFLLLFCRPVFLKTLGVNLTGIWEWL